MTLISGTPVVHWSFNEVKFGGRYQFSPILDKQSQRFHSNLCQKKKKLCRNCPPQKKKWVGGDMNVSECRQAKRAQQRREPETRTRTRRRRRTEELLRITSQSCVSYLWSVHRPAAGEEIPPSAGKHAAGATSTSRPPSSSGATTSPTLPSPHRRPPALRAQVQKIHTEGQSLQTVRFPTRYGGASLTSQPRLHPPPPTLARSQRSAERPKRRDQTEVRWVSLLASVFFQKITKPLNPAGQLKR